MDRVHAWILTIPLITRAWFLAIITTSILSTLGIVSKTNLVFIPNKILSGEIWRLFTSFLYFGDLSIELILNLWFIIRSYRFLEESFTTRTEFFSDNFDNFNQAERKKLQDLILSNRSKDYFYFIIQICFSIVIGVLIGYYKFNHEILILGSLLDDVLLYIWCKSNPNINVNVLGIINVRTAYLPWCYILMNIFLSSSFFENFTNLVNRNAFSFKHLLKQLHVWKICLSYFLGHFWWFSKTFMFTNLYYDKDKNLRLLSVKIKKKYRIRDSDQLMKIFKCFLTPPWYWYLI